MHPFKLVFGFFGRWRRGLPETTWSGIARSCGSSVVHFLGTLHTDFHSGCTKFAFLATVHEGSLVSTSSPTPVVSCVFYFSHPDRRDLIVVWGCICLMANDVEHLLKCLLGGQFLNLVRVFISGLVLLLLGSPWNPWWPVA